MPVKPLVSGRHKEVLREHLGLNGVHGDHD